MSRVTDLVDAIRRHRDLGLVVTHVYLSPATAAELAVAEPVPELEGIPCEPRTDSDVDWIDARVRIAAGRRGGR